MLHPLRIIPGTLYYTWYTFRQMKPTFLSSSWPDRAFVGSLFGPLFRDVHPRSLKRRNRFGPPTYWQRPLNQMTSSVFYPSSMRGIIISMLLLKNLSPDFPAFLAKTIRTNRKIGGKN